VRISFDDPTSSKLKIGLCALVPDICSNPYLICELTPHGEITRWNQKEKGSKNTRGNVDEEEYA
jgi:hypothetical protein